ncbi:OsmC family protein [Luedemannella flava]|uniref:OsmC family protein n=1 Tax=Luedemannella flava TaxID=349316 RepID=A0ABP4Z2J2_9ACTN
MATQHRSITIERTPGGGHTVTNSRGGQLTFASGDDAAFTPVELLLAAIGGCTALDVAALTSRRAEPEEFRVEVSANKVRDEGGNRLTDIQVTFHVSFPDTPEGDAARGILPTAVQRSHDRLCTVSRTVELGTPVASVIDEGRDSAATAQVTET